MMIRKTVRVLLLSDKNELLLMCVEDFDITTLEGTRNKRFWCTIGGGIKAQESVEQAALRELYEETGLSAQDVTLESIVWYGDVDLVLKGVPTRFKETFIVAKAKRKDVGLHTPTEEEKRVVKALQWFSLVDIQKSPEVIFPVILPEYLPDILSNNYPEKPIKIHVDSKPTQ